MIHHEPSVNIDDNLSKISKQIDNVARGVRDLSSWQAVMDVVHLMFDWSSSAQGRAEVEALLSEAQKADLSKRAVSMHNRTRSLPASVPCEFKTLCKALSGFLISIATPVPSPKCVSQVIRLLAAASAELQKTAAAKVTVATPRVTSSPGTPTPGTPTPLGALQQSEGVSLAARYRTYAYTCAAAVGQLYSAVSLPALVQTLPTQDVKDLKGSAFQAALDAAEHVLAHGLPGQGGGFVYAPAGPSTRAAAVCGVQLARHLLSSALEIANGLSRQHKIQFADTLLRLAVDMIARGEKQQQQAGSTSASPGEVSMGSLSDAAYLLQLSLQTLELLPAPLPSEASASSQAVRKLQVKLHLSLAHVFMTSHQCDKAFASLTNVDELRGPVGDSDEDRNLDLTVQYARFRILLSDGQVRVAEGVLFRALLPRAPFEACLEVLKVYVAMGLYETGGPSPGAKAKEAEASILKLYAVVTDRWPRDPEFASSRLQLLKSLLLACPPGHEQPPSAALRLADLVCTEHATRRRVLSSGHLAQLQSLLLSQMGHEHGLGHWAASLALGDSLRLLLHPSGDHHGSSLAETTGQVLCLQADCYSHLAASAEGQGSCKELLSKAHERAAAAHAADPSPRTLTLTFKAGLSAAMAGADTSDAAVVEAAIKASEALPLRVQGGGGQGKSAATASGAHLSRLLDLLAAIKAVPQPSPAHLAAKARLLQAWRDHYRAHAHLHADAGLGSASGGRVGYVAVLCEGLADFLEAHHRTPGFPGSPIRQPPASGIGAILAASSSLDMAVESPFPAPHAERGGRGADIRAGAEASLHFSPALILRSSPAQDGEALTQPQTPMAMDVSGFEGHASLAALRDMPLPSPLPLPPQSTGPEDPAWLACAAVQVHAGVVQPLLDLLLLLLAEPPLPEGQGKEAEDQAWEERFAYALSVGAAVAGLLLRPGSVRPAASAPALASAVATTPAPAAPAPAVAATSSENGVPGPDATFGSQLVMGALLFELLSRLQPWTRGCPAKTWAGAEAALDAVRQARFLLLAAVARLDAQAVQTVFTLGQGQRGGGSSGGSGGGGGEDAALCVLYPVGLRCPLAVTLPVAATPAADDDTADAMAVDAARTSHGAGGQVWLSNLASAGVCAHLAHCLLTGPALGSPEPAAGPVLRPVALVVLLAALCRYHRLEAGSCAPAAHALHPVLALPPADLVSRNLPAYQALSAGELQHCIDVASSEDMPMPVLRSLTLAAYQACFRVSHAPNPNPGALSFGAGLDPAPDPRGLARTQGRLLWRLMELAESRQEALERVCDFEQLAQSLSRGDGGGDGGGLSSSSSLHPYGSHADAMDAESEGPLDQEAGCPFATADTEAAIALAFNYGVSLVDLEQEALAEKFMARALGLLAFASPPFRAAWTGRMTDSYATVLERATRKQEGQRGEGGGLGGIFGLVASEGQ